MRYIVSLLTLVALIFASRGEASACTSAVVSAQRSSEGVPLLWKHRDSKYWNTIVKHIAEEGFYAYTAIVYNTEEQRYTSAFAGINERSFGIISTSSRDLPHTPEAEYPKDRPSIPDNGPQFTARALRECASVEDFERMLQQKIRKRGFTGNYAVADGSGALAYFEVWDIDYRRYDTSERKEGFDVRSNFSWAGDPKTIWKSKRRYDIVMQELGEFELSEKFSPHYLISLSRSYNSTKYGDVLYNDNYNLCQNHTVARHSSVAAIVLICDSKEPRMLVMNGHPVASVAVPVYVRAKEDIPQCVRGSEMTNLGQQFCAKAYSWVEKKRYNLNKEVISGVLRIESPEIAIPQSMPKNIKTFNRKIDKQFSIYKNKVTKLLCNN